MWLVVTNYIRFYVILPRYFRGGAGPERGGGGFWIGAGVLGAGVGSPNPNPQ
jgi:hypothetical protein